MAVLNPTRIEKTPETCGGNARIASTRIPVWLIVLQRKMGQTNQQILSSYPTLSQDDLDAAWEYFRQNPLEIQQAIWFNDTAANVPEGSPVPPAVIVAGRLLGLSDDEIREAFDPALSSNELEKAWEHYRADPQRLEGDMAAYRRAG